MASRIERAVNRVLKEIKSSCKEWEGDDDMVKMFTADYNYAEYCFNEYKQMNNHQKFYDDLYNQDTAAREKFCEVFRMLEKLG